MYRQMIAGFLVGIHFLNGLINVTPNVLEEENKTNEMENVRIAENEFETPNGMSAKEFCEYCEEYFGEKYSREIPGISMAVVSHGKIVYEKGFGYSNVEEQIPSNPETTVYEYGSVSKLFTWVSLMQLAEEGRISLTDDVKPYLPESFLMPTSYEKEITFLDLMNHQAGYDDYVLQVFLKEQRACSLREALEEHKVNQLYEPGYASSYSNYSVALAGYLVETITGMPEDQYVKEAIFQKAGMEHATLSTNWYKDETLVANKANVYTLDGNELCEQNWTHVPMYPAGGANGTVRDLANFAMALLDQSGHPLFEKSETVSEMLSPSYEAAPGVEGIAHGFIEYDGEYPTYWHNGETMYSSTFFAVVPELEFGLVACVNSDNIEPLEEFCFTVLGKQEVVMDTPEKNLPDTKEVEGWYGTFQSPHNNATEFFGLISLLEYQHVKAVDESHIMIGEEQYLQIRPYVYQSMETGRKIAFCLKDGSVYKMASMLDAIKVSTITYWSMVGRVAGFGLILLSVVIAIVLLFVKLVSNKRTLYEVVPGGIIAAWMIVFGNIVSFLSVLNGDGLISQARSFSIMNSILAIMIVGLGTVLLMNKQKDSFWNIWYRLLGMISILGSVLMTAMKMTVLFV